MTRELYALPRQTLGGASAGPGWAYYADAEYTSGSPLSILANTRTQITVDGLGATTETDYLETVPETVWDNAAIWPSATGEAYLLRIGLTIVPQEVTSNEYASLQLDIGGGSQIVIAEKRLALQKGLGNAHLFSEALPIFCLATFNANGGRLYIEPTLDVQLYGASLFIQRTFSP